MTRNRLAEILALVCLTAATPSAAAQSGFTYQGWLDHNGAPANGTYRFEVALWDAASGGNRLTSPWVATQEVVGGLFTIAPDLGPSVFTDQDRWIEIVVDGVTLSPRQAVTAAPLAIHTRGIQVDGGGNVGIGTTQPERVLHTSGDTVLFERAADDAGVTIRNTRDGAIEAFWGLRSTGPDDGRAFLTDEDLTPLLYLDDGFVGVGRSDRVTPYEFFGLYRDTTSFGGMYIETAATGAPCYGYSAGGDVDAYHYFDSAADAWRLVNGAGQLTLTDDGYFGIGNPTPDFPLHIDSSAHNTLAVLSSTRGSQNLGTLVVSADNTTSGYALKVTADGPSGNTAAIYAASFNRNGAGVDAVAAAPGVTNYGVRAASYSSSGYDFYAYGPGINYGSSSSARWKHAIEPIDDPLGKVSRLRGVCFDWDADHGGHRDIGMIAEEVGEVLPEIVGYEENGVDALGMDYAKLTPLLVEAVKALRSEKDAEIAALHAENRSLRARLDSLEAAVLALASRPAAHPEQRTEP